MANPTNSYTIEFTTLKLDTYLVSELLSLTVYKIGNCCIAEWSTTH